MVGKYIKRKRVESKKNCSVNFDVAVSDLKFWEKHGREVM